VLRVGSRQAPDRHARRAGDEDRAGTAGAVAERQFGHGRRGKGRVARPCCGGETCSGRASECRGGQRARTSSRFRNTVRTHPIECVVLPQLPTGRQCSQFRRSTPLWPRHQPSTYLTSPAEQPTTRTGRGRVGRTERRLSGVRPNRLAPRYRRFPIYALPADPACDTSRMTQRNGFASFRFADAMRISPEQRRSQEYRGTAVPPSDLRDGVAVESLDVSRNRAGPRGRRSSEACDTDRGKPIKS
jgi:hypothetical protein